VATERIEKPLRMFSRWHWFLYDSDGKFYCKTQVSIAFHQALSKCAMLVLIFHSLSRRPGLKITTSRTHPIILRGLVCYRPAIHCKKTTSYEPWQLKANKVE
jgi:hypothetical protein